MKKKIGWYLTGVLALAMVAHASVIVYNAMLVNETALAYSNTYVLDLNKNGINNLSAQAVYSSATVSNVTFGDGAQSVGTATVLNYVALSSASATNHLTVTSTSALIAATIAVPGYTFRQGVDWGVGANVTATALNIKNALAKVPYLSVSASGGVVYATATYGSIYNSYGMSSNNGSLVVASPKFSGGRDNAVFTMNGVGLLQGRQWFALTSNAATATSLASAINASSYLGARVHAAASGAVVTSTSTLADASANYSMVSSTPTALSLSGAAMTGGITSAVTLNSSLFIKASHGLPLALPVLYSGTPVIGGLAASTTYYAIPVTAGSFRLSTSQAGALAGTGLVVVTSTNTQLAQHTYTLAPLAISGTPSFKWQVSNDNSNWEDLAVSSVTMSSYSNPPASTLWSFGFIGTQYIRLKVVGPTTGAIYLKVSTIGTN